jgi:hypothetical protein
VIVGGVHPLSRFCRLVPVFSHNTNCPVRSNCFAAARILALPRSCLKTIHPFTILPLIAVDFGRFEHLYSVLRPRIRSLDERRALPLTLDTSGTTGPVLDILNRIARG